MINSLAGPAASGGGGGATILSLPELPQEVQTIQKIPLGNNQSIRRNMR
jgi:hypothetical protein